MTTEEKQKLVSEQQQKIKNLTEQLKEEKAYLSEINIPSEEDVKRFKRMV